jgi:hypothetical protein
MDVAGRERPRRAAGTRGARDLVRSLGRPPSDTDIARDINAVRAGAALVVSCAVRGSAAPYPRRFRHGELLLAGRAAQWKPHRFSLSRSSIAVDAACTSLKSRARNARTDWNSKSSGVYRPNGLVPSSGFTVLVCITRDGWREFAVPTLDVPVVKAFFERPPTPPTEH